MSRQRMNVGVHFIKILFNDHCTYIKMGKKQIHCIRQASVNDEVNIVFMSLSWKMLWIQCMFEDYATKKVLVSFLDFS